MDTVWIVRASLKHDDGEAIIGVFSTKEKAELRCREIKCNGRYVDPYIDEREVES